MHISRLQQLTRHFSTCMFYVGSLEIHALAIMCSKW